MEYSAPFDTQGYHQPNATPVTEQRAERRVRVHSVHFHGIPDATATGVGDLAFQLNAGTLIYFHHRVAGSALQIHT